MFVKGTGLLLLSLLFVVGGAGAGQDAPAPKQKRTVYVVRHRDVKELAAVLSKFFKGDAEIQVLPESNSNTLLLRAEPQVVEEILKVLERVDQAPRLVAVELLLAEIPTQAGAGGKAVEEKELTGSSQAVLAKVEALRRSGAMSVFKQMRFTAVENQSLTLQNGEMTPYVTGVTLRPNGAASKMVQQQSTGTVTAVTARVRGQSVALDLNLSDSRLIIPPDGIEIGKDENGNVFRAPIMARSSWNTTLTIPSGQATALHSIKTDGKGGTIRTVLIVAVRIQPESTQVGKDS
jgi:type II secretory pathway component GspD/PulD (secretin)